MQLQFLIHCVENGEKKKECSNLIEYKIFTSAKKLVYFTSDSGFFSGALNSKNDVILSLHLTTAAI